MFRQQFIKIGVSPYFSAGWAQNECMAHSHGHSAARKWWPTSKSTWIFACSVISTCHLIGTRDRCSQSYQASNYTVLPSISWTHSWSWERKTHCRCHIRAVEETKGSDFVPRITATLWKMYHSIMDHFIMDFQHHLSESDA